MQIPSEATRDNWPVPLASVFAWRLDQLEKFRKSPVLLDGAKAYYRRNKAEFILHWIDTFDPRVAGTGRPSRMPFVMFRKQIELCEFLDACVEGKANGLVEKCRDAGATWVCSAWSVTTWLFEPGVSIGWGSRKEDLVDRLGDADSIFEKMRMIIRGLPSCFLPPGFSFREHATHMKIINPSNESSITGESGDNIGRGGRKLIYFKDESAHYPRPELIEAALADNTNTQIDISSVNGPGNVFYRRRRSGIDWQPGQPVVRDRTNVFVIDWRDHPGKTQEWYDTRRRKSEDEGLLHVFAQEVDRDYFSALEGVIIPAKWVESSIDAHIKLDIRPRGRIHSALDVADEGGDTNAQSFRKGVLLYRVDEWGERDTGVTTRRAIMNCKAERASSMEYDSIGIGSGVKAEANRLKDDSIWPEGLHLSPWNAGASVLNPRDRVVPDDEESMRNEDFFKNLKAQAWWSLRRRFEITHRAVTEPEFTYNPDDIISLSSRMTNLQKIKTELSQPTAGYSTTLQLLINKKPDGTTSPNLADSIVMNYFPVPAPVAQLLKVRIG